MSFSLTQTWVQILASSLLTVGLSGLLKSSCTSWIEERYLTDHNPMRAAQHRAGMAHTGVVAINLFLLLQSSPQPNRAKSLFPYSRCKTISTLNRIQEFCAPWIRLLLPYQRVEGEGQLEPLWSESYQRWFSLYFFVCLVYLPFFFYFLLLF